MTGKKTSALTTEGAITSSVPAVPSRNPSAAPNFVPASQIVVQVSLSIRMNYSFNSKLTDKTSFEFFNMSQRFLALLEPIYKATPGYLGIVIVAFSDGSVKCHHNVSCKIPPTNASQVKEFFSTEAKADLKNVTDFPQDVDDTISSAMVEFNRTVEAEITGSCKDHPGYTYEEGQCRSPCSTQNPCSSHGTCDVDSQGDSFCRCDADDTYVYSGDSCSTRTEKNQNLPSSTIIGIAAGVGGGVVCILIVFVIFVSRCRMKKSLDDESGSDPSTNPYMSMFESGSRRYTSSAPRFDAEYYREVPDLNDVDFSGPVFRDSRRSSNFSVFARPVAWHNHVDTQAQFKIKRPNFKISPPSSYDG